MATTLASTVSGPIAAAVSPPLVISEVMAANDTHHDGFGETPDWFELHNSTTTTIDLAGWTIADSDANAWPLPARALAPGDHLLVWASGRDHHEPELHADFALKSSGEILTLADPAGTVVDTIAYPDLDDDQAWGRGSDGRLGHLAVATPGTANSALLPAQVRIDTPPQTFITSLDIALAAPLAPGETIRYTTDGTAVDADATVYTGSLTITTTTVVRSAVVSDTGVGVETSAAYTEVAPSLRDFSSDLPIVLVHTTGVVGDENQDAVITIIEPGADGRAGVFDEPAYGGFGALRIRGASSADFPKKQYKFETWSDPTGTEVDVDLLGLGAESDWGLYAPGRYDRAMINNPLMYELGDRLGVAAPDYRFVEVFVEDNIAATVGSGDYMGLFVLRESIEIDDSRLDLTEHTDTSAGPDGGYIMRYDWVDDCCATIADHPDFASKIQIDSPNRARLTGEQFEWMQRWWADLQTAAATDFSTADEYIDFDSLIDGWLLALLAMDVDILRASHYMHLDAGGQLRAGPLWDFDRSLGAADSRVDGLAKAESWEPDGRSGHSYDSDIYGDLWEMPEVQSRLRARWAELRTAALADHAVGELIGSLGGEIAEAFGRETARWGDGGVTYGPRFAGGLEGELEHMTAWVEHRARWLDEQLLSDSEPPVVADPGPITLEQNEPVRIAIEVTAAGADAKSVAEAGLMFAARGLPAGLELDARSGEITGRVAYGNAGTYQVAVTVADSAGASARVGFAIDVAAEVAGAPAVALNEFNAVAPGLLLGDGGSDLHFGRVAGNGGDWFELVTVDDGVDMRGWSFDVWHEGPDGSVAQTARLVLGELAVLGDLAAGSIVTVAESVPDDLSYAPDAGDWTLNLQANNSRQGVAFVNQTGFDTNAAGWRLVIRDREGLVRAEIVGETGRWDDANGGVGGQDVFAMGVDPSADLDPVTDWVEARSSSFGAPNVIGDFVQDFAALRAGGSDEGVLGDVNCDGAATIADALMIVQFLVETRSEASCPLADSATQVDLTHGDVSGDGTVDVLDALFISRCQVGITTPACPS